LLNVGNRGGAKILGRPLKQGDPWQVIRSYQREKWYDDLNRLWDGSLCNDRWVWCYMNLVDAAAMPQTEATQDQSNQPCGERSAHGFGEVAVVGLRISKSFNARWACSR
jgi:hypothetical protein